MLDVRPAGRCPQGSGGREVGLWRDDAGQIFARLFSDGFRRWIDWTGLGVFAFESGRDVVQLWPAADARMDVVRDVFARMVQPAVLQALGRETLHASAAVGPNGVLVFCGLAHSGKSTLAFALGRTGYRHFADDAVVMTVAGDDVLAHPVPFSPRLRASARGHFAPGSLPPPVDRPDEPQTVSAFFVLRQEEQLEGPPQVTRLPPAHAFVQLLTHAHCFDPADMTETRRLVGDYLEIVRLRPVFSVVYRPAFAEIADLVTAVSAAAGLAPAAPVAAFV